MCLGVFPTQPLLEFLAFPVPNPNPISKSHSKYQIPVPSHSPVPLTVPKRNEPIIRLSSAGSPPNVCRIWQWDMGIGFWTWNGTLAWDWHLGQKRKKQLLLQNQRTQYKMINFIQ